MPAVARTKGSGDIVNTVHNICVAPGDILTETGSSDVFVVNHGAHRKTDLNEAHTHCPPVYSTEIVTHSLDVFANGLELARLGDTYSCTAKIKTVQQQTVWANEGHVPPIILSSAQAASINTQIQQAIENPPDVGATGGEQANGTIAENQVPVRYEGAPAAGVDDLGTTTPLVEASAANSTAAADGIPGFLTQVLAEANNNQWDEYGTNPNILNLWIELGFPDTAYWKTDSTPWCAGFCNWVLKRTGYKYMQSAKAYDFRDKTSVYGGVPVPLSDGQPGDIVVWNYSHVNFIYTVSSPGIYSFVGGNQSDKASATNNNPSGGTITNSWKGGWTQSRGRISGIFRPVVN
tara:strand:- start:87 stop:1130 length:1044 start_codon:yes stop_codon:yes gene_type:complete